MRSKLLLGMAVAGVAFGIATAVQASIPPSNCPGVGQGAAGHLCLYETFGGNRTDPVVVDPTSGTAASSKDGFSIHVAAAGDGPVFSYGTWAVTAP
jgi:hypothetical protein